MAVVLMAALAVKSGSIEPVSLPSFGRLIIDLDSLPHLATYPPPGLDSDKEDFLQTVVYVCV
jgi:hypothetical protein